MQLGDYATRKPGQLSGGQQQRVALARALVLTPQVLLLDEPLGALDARLRKDLQVELKALQAELGITFVFVTHDQEEALTMSDRVAVMSGGRVEQVGPPREMYEAPATLFVADFLGVSNLVAAHASPDGEACSLRIGERTLRASAGATGARGEVKAMIRPERVVVEAQGAAGENRLPGMVERAVYVGSTHELHVRLVGGDLLKATIRNDGSPFAFEEGTAGHPPPAAGSACAYSRPLTARRKSERRRGGARPASPLRLATRRVEARSASALARLLAVDEPEIEQRVEAVCHRGEAPAGRRRARRRRETEPSAPPFLDQLDHAAEPGAVRALDERAQLVVRTEAAPHLVPERALLAERDVRLDADEQHALDPRRARRHVRRARR